MGLNSKNAITQEMFLRNHWFPTGVMLAAADIGSVPASTTNKAERTINNVSWTIKPSMENIATKIVSDGAMVPCSARSPMADRAEPKLAWPESATAWFSTQVEKLSPASDNRL